MWRVELGWPNGMRGGLHVLVGQPILLSVSLRERGIFGYITIHFVLMFRSRCTLKRMSSFNQHRPRVVFHNTYTSEDKKKDSSKDRYPQV